MFQFLGFEMRLNFWVFRISGFLGKLRMFGCWEKNWVSGEKYGCLVVGKIWVSGENMGVWLLGKKLFSGKHWGKNSGKKKNFGFFLLIIREKKKIRIRIQVICSDTMRNFKCIFLQSFSLTYFFYCAGIHIYSYYFMLYNKKHTENPLNTKDKKSVITNNLL